MNYFSRGRGPPLPLDSPLFAYNSVPQSLNRLAARDESVGGGGLLLATTTLISSARFVHYSSDS